MRQAGQIAVSREAQALCLVPRYDRRHGCARECVANTIVMLSLRLASLDCAIFFAVTNYRPKNYVCVTLKHNVVGTLALTHTHLQSDHPGLICALEARSVHCRAHARAHLLHTLPVNLRVTEPVAVVQPRKPARGGATSETYEKMRESVMSSIPYAFPPPREVAHE